MEFIIGNGDLIVDDYICKLKESGVNFDDESYRESEEFKKLKDQYLYHDLPLDWAIERKAVSPELLAKIYGKYALGVNTQLSDEELQPDSLINYIAGEHLKTGKAIDKKDYDELNSVQKTFLKNYHSKRNYISEYLFRRRNTNNKTKSLVEILDDFGVNTTAFDEKADLYRLLYFLYDIENPFDGSDYLSINLDKLLNTPSIESTDLSELEMKTIHGKVIRTIKTGLVKAIEIPFVAKTRQLLIKVQVAWDDLESILSYNCLFNKINNVAKHQIISNINNCLRLFEELAIKHKKSYGVYTHSLLETFYLKIREYEYKCFESDFITINKALPDIYDGIFEPLFIDVVKESNHYIKYTEVQTCLNNNRLLYGKCILGKEKLDANDRKKIKTIFERSGKIIEMLRKHFSYFTVNDTIPLSLVLIVLKIYATISKNKYIDNRYYRYETANIKKLYAEYNDGDKAFSINQIAWARLAAYSYNIVFFNKDIAQEVLEFHIIISRLFKHICCANSLESMQHTDEVLYWAVNSIVNKITNVPSYILRFNLALGMGYKLQTDLSNTELLFLCLFGDDEVLQLIAREQRDIINRNAIRPIEFGYNIKTNITIYGSVLFQFDHHDKSIKIEKIKFHF